MHGVLVNRLGGLSLPRKSVVRLTDRPDMTLDVYRGRKTTKQQKSLTATMLTMSSISEIMIILMAIKSNFIGFYDKQNHTLVVIPYKIYETCQRQVS